MLVYVFLAMLRCCGNFLCICREMEYIIPFLFILAGKHFCWGSMDALSLPGASGEAKVLEMEKKMVLKRGREFCYFCTLFCLGSGNRVRNNASIQCFLLVILFIDGERKRWYFLTAPSFSELHRSSRSKITWCS